MDADALDRLRGGRVLVAGLFSDTPARRRGAEDLLHALKQAGIAARSFDLADAFGRPATIAVPDACLEQELADIAFTHIIIAAPPGLAEAACQRLGARLCGTPRLIAFWDNVPGGQQAAMRQAARHLSAIWVPTLRLAEITLAALSDFAGEIDIVRPRRSAPPPPGEDRAAIRARLALPPEAFVVGLEVAMEDGIGGQNPLGAIAAFRAAFDTDPQAWLVLRCAHPEQNRAEFASLVQAAAHPRILVLDTHRHYVPRASLLRVADAWVDLSCDAADRAVMDDALGAGLPVLACASGLSAAHWADARLLAVRFTLPGQAGWATPDAEHAAHLLRGLRARPPQAAEMAGGRTKDVATG